MAIVDVVVAGEEAVVVLDVAAVVMVRDKVVGLEARFVMDSRRREGEVDVVHHGRRWLSVVLDRLLEGLVAGSDERSLCEEAGGNLRP